MQSTLKQQHRPKLVVIGGIISLVAILAAIVGSISCQFIFSDNISAREFYQFFSLLVAVPFFILGLAISTIGLIVYFIRHFIMCQKGIPKNVIKSTLTNEGTFLPSAKIAFAILFGLIGGYILIMTISTPADNTAVPVLCGLILIVFSVLLFVVGIDKKQ